MVVGCDSLPRRNIFAHSPRAAQRRAPRVTQHTTHALRGSIRLGSIIELQFRSCARVDIQESRLLELYLTHT